MKKLVNTSLSGVTVRQWLDIMDSVDLDTVEDVKDFASLAETIWRELLELQRTPNLGVLAFIETNAPVYDSWQLLDDKYCCEKTLLKERERLTLLAKDSGK